MLNRRKLLQSVAASLALVSLGNTLVEASGGGGSATWPIATAPVPVPGTVISNTNKKIVTTTTKTVTVALAGLDQAYLNLGWTLGAAVNEPRTYTKTINGKRIKIIVFFAALDPTAANGFIRAQFTQTWNQL